MARPVCLQCSQEFEVGDFLSHARGYTTSTDSGAAPCPKCGSELEFRVNSDRLELGYTYWAGSFHFEGMKTFPVSGLRLLTSPLAFELNGVTIPLPH